MTRIRTVEDLLAAIGPVVGSMLTPGEVAGSEFWVGVDADLEFRVPEDEPLAGGDMALWWRILGEVGMSFLWLDDGEQPMLLKIADDLQDFVAESAFGWGELRPIPPVAQS